MEMSTYAQRNYGENTDYNYHIVYPIIKSTPTDVRYIHELFVSEGVGV